MVRVLVDYDLVAIPEPVIAEIEVVGGYAEVETTEPETLPVPSSQAEDMAAAEAAGEVPVFPWMIEVVMRIVAPGIVPNPFIVGMNVGCFGMALLVRKVAVLFRSRFPV